MKLDATHSALLLVDMQNRLAPAIADFSDVEQQCRWLLEVAHQLNIPVLATEQYPQGLGVTVQSLLALLGTDQIVEKIHFDATAEPDVLAWLADHKIKQVVLAGCEAHVCVLQSALGLLERDIAVYVVVDAVGSRRSSDKQLALARLQHAGAVLVSREMVAFEWLQRAGTEQFRALSQSHLKPLT